MGSYNDKSTQIGTWNLLKEILFMTPSTNYNNNTNDNETHDSFKERLRKTGGNYEVESSTHEILFTY